MSTKRSCSFGSYIRDPAAVNDLPLGRSVPWICPAGSPRRSPAASYRLTIFRFPYGSAVYPLNLTPYIHSVARVSRRNDRRRSTPHRRPSLLSSGEHPLVRRSPYSRRGFTRFSTSARNSFQRSLTLLVRYRSPWIFRLGRVCLPSSAGVSTPAYSAAPAFSRQPATGLSPSEAQLSRRVCHRHEKTWTPPHLPFGIQVGLFPFRSPLLRESHLLSFPASTIMLWSDAFPCRRPPA